MPGERLLGPDSPELLGGAAEGPLAGLHVGDYDDDNRGYVHSTRLRSVSPFTNIVYIIRTFSSKSIYSIIESHKEIHLDIGRLGSDC